MPRRKRTLKSNARQDLTPPFMPTALLQAVIDAMPSGVAILDREMHYLVVNAAWKSSTGIGAEAIGMTPIELFNLPVQYSKDLFGAALAGQEVIKTFKTPNGEHLDQVTIGPWRDENGEVAGVITRHPIGDTFRRRQEARERRMQMAMAMGKVFALEVDFRTGEIIYEPPNPLGIESGKLRSFEDMLAWLPPGESDTFRRLWAEHLAGADVVAHEFPAVMPGGEISWRKSIIEAVRGFDGEVVGFVGITQIIDQQKQAEFALIAEKEAAQVADRSKSQFLANMSHEIRTPLTSVLGFADLLGHLEGLPLAAQSYIRRISTAGQSLLSVINDILDFSKLEAGQLELDPGPFDPPTCVEGVIDLLAVQAADKGLELKLDIPPDLRPVWLTADGARIRQVLINLVGNAVKFTDRGHVAVTVRYQGTPTDQLQIAVSDTGPGIAEDLRFRLFQRFSQADGSGSRRHGGSGLGLAICKSLIELMGGTIGFESEFGRGSTFRLSIPVSASAPEAQPETPAESEAPETRTAHILVVDDVATNRELIRAMLAPLGYSFEEADNGPDAIKAARRSHFDLILMDLQMPGMDGLAATRMIRATAKVNRETPILAFSANVLAEQIELAHAAGMVDHISKPIQPVELLTKVAMWTSSPSDEDEDEQRRKTASSLS